MQKVNDTRKNGLLNKGWWEEVIDIVSMGDVVENICNVDETFWDIVLQGLIVVLKKRGENQFGNMWTVRSRELESEREEVGILFGKSPRLKRSEGIDKQDKMGMVEWS